MHVYADEPGPLGPPSEAELNAQYERDQQGREHYERDLWRSLWRAVGSRSVESSHSNRRPAPSTQTTEAYQARLRAAFPLPTDPPVAADAVGDTPEEVSDA